MSSDLVVILVAPLASVLVAVLTLVPFLVKGRHQLSEIHVLVNDRMERMVLYQHELTAALVAMGGVVPPQAPPDGELPEGLHIVTPFPPAGDQP